jgi:outer membrane protein TolC
MDEFKIDLGLPADEEIAIEVRQLEYAPVDKDIETYVRLALANRLDLKTANDIVEDSKRNLEIARNRMRSRLDFGFSLQTATDPAERFNDQEFGDAEWAVGLEYEIPFDRLSERTDYRRQLIDYLRRVREREELRDQVIVEVRSVIRDLRKAETTMEIQERNIEIAEKQLERAKSDYDRGTITNRDVVDALNDLTDALNNYEEATVDYTVAELELLRVAGALDFENWRDLIK